MLSRLIRPFSALLATTLLFTGCGDKPDSSSSNSTKKVIGASCITLTNPYFTLIKDVMTEEAGKNGYEVIFLSGDQDPDKQANQVEDFIIKKVDAIALNPCDSKSIGSAIKRANEAGIPVFTFDIKCQADDVDIVSHIATDNIQGGRLAAEAMIEALGEDGGEVAILDYKSVESCIMRVDGFKEVINRHNDGRTAGMVRIVAELPGEGLRNKGYQAAEDALQAHPKLAGIFAINDPSGLGAAAALEKAGRTDDIVIVAFDGQPEGKQAVKDGKIHATPVQFPARIARMTVKAVADHFEGEDVPAEQLIAPELYRMEEAQKDKDLD